MMKIERPDRTTLLLAIESEAETDRLGRALAEVVEPGVVIGLVGDLGAGKTRLTRSLAEAMGVDPGAIASPTFVLIHEYDGRLPIYHFDAYRLDNPGQFTALGAADYWLDGQGVCLIEWADRVRSLLPPDTWWITIELDGPERRRVQITSPKADRLAELLGFPDVTI